MFNPKLKIASISAEVDPYSKSGGLADVSRSLPKALKRLDHEVIVVTPFYGAITNPEKHKLKKIHEDITIIIDDKHKEKVNFWQGELMDGLPVYLIENEKYFSKRKDLYGSSHENARFLLFDLAALKLLTKIRFKADIIQCHDWQTGLIPYFLKSDFQNSDVLKKTATVFTIHNLTFQLGHNWWEISPKFKDDGKSNLPNLDDPKIEGVNFAKRAILNADMINAVSEKYAEEILTKDFGQELHRILKNREDRVVGIVNGIDYKDYNPKNDPGLNRNFDYYSSHLKEKNKLYIQKTYGLPQDKNIPLICMTSRIAEQKGFDLIKNISDIIFRFNLQLIIMGDGDEKMIKHLRKLQKENPKKLVHIFFHGEGNKELITQLKKSEKNNSLENLLIKNSKMETSLYAGSDFILIPSRFEPCGLTQMKAMRYGCVPVARYIGGYVDTLDDYNPKHKLGNGFVFKVYDARDMAIAISRGIETFKRKDEWKELVEKIMRQSFSWEYPARKYIDLFKKAIKVKEKNGK
ncbi:glycogen synthase [Patescibacteria group bacterium]